MNEEDSRKVQLAATNYRDIKLAQATQASLLQYL
jgi:hypothetical protein